MRAVMALITAMTILTACVSEPSPSPTAEPTPTATPAPSPTPSPTPEPSPTPSPTATPEPPLSLPPATEVDGRVVSVSIAVDVPPEADGRILVTVTSAAETIVEELVLRWPADLAETLFLAPFVPSDDRIREGGPPLVQPWTKWVVGPGERGEPAGTVSLGYGPLLAGATIEIPLFVTRLAPGPVAFDLQVLAGEAILSLDGGEPAELRVEVP